MSKKKTYIGLIVFIIIFFIVMFALFGIDNIRRNRYTTVLIVGNNNVWSYQKQKWANYSSLSSINDLNWQEYNIYLNNEEFGKYQLWHDDKWYAFDNKKNAIKLEGDLLAYKANHKMPIHKFTEETITDMDPVYQMLEDNGVDASSKFTSSYKVTFDFDNDKVDEEFYLISNAFPMDFNPSKIFSLAFMVDEDKIYPIYTDVSENTSYDGCKPYYTTFLDVDNDKKYEFVLSCSRYSIYERIDMLYQFVDGEFKIIISNQ